MLMLVLTNLVRLYHGLAVKQVSEIAFAPTQMGQRLSGRRA